MEEDLEPRPFSGWFEHWVDRQPGALALSGDDGMRLSYGELEQAANQVANAIDALDPTAAFPMVAIALDQSSAGVIAIVGAAKTGRPIVPLDVAAPPEQLAAALALVPPAVVLTSAEDLGAVALVPAPRRLLLPVDDLLGSGDPRRVRRRADPDGVEVVLFTSGSTGRPKGVPRPSRASRAVHARDQDPTGAPSAAREALTSEVQWTAGWTSLCDALAVGASVHRYSTRRRGPGELARWLAEEGVTSWGTIPSLLRATLDVAPPDLTWPRLQSLRLSGEDLPWSLVDRSWARLPPGATIRSRYGASETGAISGWTLDRDARTEGPVVPVGWPEPGTRIQIQDPGPDGVGEVVVETAHGARCYLGGAPGDALSEAADGWATYRTGDRGRLSADGALALLGRSDRVVKVRGHRVDLDGVERVLRDLPDVLDASVALADDPTSARLTAWVVVEPGPAASVVGLRRLLRKRLPGYMVPTTIVLLDRLPRSSRGKLERSRLPVPPAGRPALDVPYAPPEGPVEQAVASAFARVLDAGPVGRHDAFFDLGGDSLQAAEVMTRLAADLGRELPLAVFVEAETPAELAALLTGAVSGAGDHLVELQAVGDEPPLYCVHGGGGQVLSFAALATRLGTTRPFLGIQMRSGDRARRLFRVRRLARLYAGEVAARQRGRPCVIAGHSYGAIVAFELTRQLRSIGSPVAACVLLDCGLPDRRILRGPLPLGQVVTGQEDAVRRGKELAYATHAVLGLRPRPHRVTTERMQAALWGMTLYQPVPVDVPLVVVRATEGGLGRDFAGWRAHTTASCTLVDVPGDHHSILAPPHLHDLADALLAALSSGREEAVRTDR